MEDKARKVADLLRVMANEKRLMVLCNLMNGPMTVGELVDQVGGISQSGMSQHLANLKAHGILDCYKHGQSITYRIVDSRVELLIDVLRKHYCE